MIRHIVLFKVKPTVSKEAIDNAFKNLFALNNLMMVRLLSFCISKHGEN